MTASALTIAGSDSGGGAGIQADLKALAAHGVHGLSAIAALTAQNTRGVSAVHVPPVGFLRAQIDACFDDFEIRAVKLGMLATAEVIHAVADALETYQPRFVVLDPVMVATSGAKLLEDEALDALKSRLLPLASLRARNSAQCGVKAANLGAMQAAHIPGTSVPDGSAFPSRTTTASCAPTAWPTASRACSSSRASRRSMPEASRASATVMRLFQPAARAARPGARPRAR